MHDSTRPRVYCESCDKVVYCDNIYRGFPPDIARNKIKKIHKDSGCKGNIVYVAGILPMGRFEGQAGLEDNHDNV